jgi:preprotein translocase subunit SecG
MPSKIKFFKLTSLFSSFSRPTKDIISIAICMILVILASQSNAFDFLMDTHLGRLGLITSVLTICYLNHIFGSACILFLVLAFAVNYNRREGLENKKKESNKTEETEESEEETEEITENFEPVNKCAEFKATCLDCQSKEPGIYCDKHVKECKESMCGNRKKTEGYQNGGPLLLKDREMTDFFVKLPGLAGKPKSNHFIASSTSDLNPVKFSEYK